MYNYENMIQVHYNFISKEDLDILNSFFPKMENFSVKDVAFIPPIHGGQTVEYKTEIHDEEVIRVMKKYTRLGYEETKKRFIDDRGYFLENYRGRSGQELIRWSLGASLAPHADGYDYPPDWPFLDIGCLMYLNNEYSGGEIRFPEHNITITPNPGMAVFFPCHYIHEVKEIKENPNGGETRRHTMPLFYWFELCKRQ